ncbi:protein SPO16 homolog [Spea bombifrons]|uniref:protein SPO16 homolog n=1 Tax=Spea bombifrons TaxID=233779 RepID=UPI00234B1C37|nr:protein SPO16 homolog [Spea bombifrons]
MVDYGGKGVSWGTTAIVSTSLRGHEVAATLQSQQHRVRFSDGVDDGSVIFPLSGIAFLLTTAQELIETSRAVVFERIQSFISVHRNGFLVIEAALHESDEWDLMFGIQQRFLGSNLRILPAHNNGDIVKNMLIIAKATSKPHTEIIQDRILKAKTQIVESSPVWEVLDQI